MLFYRNQSGDHVTWQTVLQCLLNPETLNKNTFNLKNLGYSSIHTAAGRLAGNYEEDKNDKRVYPFIPVQKKRNNLERSYVYN